MISSRRPDAPLRVLIHADGHARADFFGKLAAGVPTEAGFDIQFITESLTAERLIAARGFPVTRLACTRGTPDATLDKIYHNSLCGVLGNINRAAAAGMKAEIDAFLADLEPQVIWCWNGTKFIDRCLKATGIPMKVLEVANIPGHFVVEDEGVNAESATYRRLVEQEAGVNAPESFDFQAWKTAYIADKEEHRPIPQASVAAVEMREKLSHLLGLLNTTPRFVLFQLDRILGYALRKTVDKRVHQLEERRRPDAEAEGTHRVFFPQQVSSDSQLIFNAEYDNISALRLLLSELPEGGVLASNLHPAEHRLSRKLAFLKLAQADDRLVPVRGGAWKQLKAADEVVTINSTVGLEATILDRPCRFLGRSPFVRLNRDPEALRWFLGAHILPNSAALDAPVRLDLIQRLRPDATA